MSFPTHNYDIQPPPTLSTTASSPQSPAVTLHQKSEILGADFESQLSQGSPAFTCIATGLKSRSVSPDLTENREKVENSPNITQNHPEPPKSPVSEHFKWADDSESLPTASITPTNHPRNFSSLRSSSANPFASLRRRHRKNLHRVIDSHPQHEYCCHHNFKFQNLRYYSSNFHIPCSLSRHPPPASLNWNHDPRLLDLSNALRALGLIQ